MRKYWVIVLSALLLSATLGLLMPLVARAEMHGSEEIALEITGEGVTTPLAFTLAELDVMEQYEQLYSTINTWPSKRWFLARGVRLRDLLALAGLKDGATLIKFTAADNYEWSLTVKELLLDKRYYFPGLKENHPTDGSIPGSSAGKQEVEPLVALLSAEEGATIEDMDDRECLMLIMGQRAVTEQTWLLFVKHLTKIEVLTTAPEKWDAPKINVPDGTALPPGVELKPENKDTDADKIYYTTDGSTPTVDSPMFNWSARRWWEQRTDVDNINIPIEIVEEMIREGLDGRETVVFKLKTIGPGREDSEVATYTFYIDPDAEDPTKISGGPATGIILDRNKINLPVGSAFQLEATLIPYNTPDKRITWRSSDTRVAAVNNSGLVTVVGPGAAVITATTVLGHHMAVCLVNGPDLEESDRVVVPTEINFSNPEPENEPPPLPEGDTDDAAPATAISGEELPGPPPEKPIVNEQQPVAVKEQFLARKEELAADFVSGDMDDGKPAEQADGLPGQIFEMSLGAVPFPLPAESPHLQVYMLIIFLILFLSGGAQRYAEYKRSNDAE